MRQVVLVEDEIEYQAHFSDALKTDEQKWSVKSFMRGEDAVNFFEGLTNPPDIAVVDIGLPDISGIEVIRRFNRRSPNVPILVYTLVPSEHMLKQALASGACGYILKDDVFFPVGAALREAIKGNSPISPKMATFLLSGLPKIKKETQDSPKLSTQEQILLELISVGNSYAVAAHRMGLKLSTVHSYSRSLFRKLQVTSKTQAIFKARELDLIN